MSLKLGSCLPFCLLWFVRRLSAWTPGRCVWCPVPGARALPCSPEVAGLQEMGWQISYTLLVQASGRDHPSHAGMCWDPTVLLFCVATRSSRGRRQWQSPLVPMAAGTGASCSAQQQPFVAPQCCGQGQQRSPGLPRLRAPALHSHGPMASAGAAAGSAEGALLPEAFFASCLLWYPKVPLSCSMWCHRAGH